MKVLREGLEGVEKGQMEERKEEEKDIKTYIRDSRTKESVIKKWKQLVTDFRRKNSTGR